jgi:plastocyanin
MPSRCHVRLSLLCTALTLSLVACGSSSKSSSSSPTTSAARGGEVITIHNLAFSPTPLPAKVGDSVTVTNKDGINHTFTANDGSFDTGAFSTGSKTVKLTKAGTTPYHCKIHTFMHGTLQVSG